MRLETNSSRGVHGNKYVKGGKNKNKNKKGI
jgi:hypothetical protein